MATKLSLDAFFYGQASLAKYREEQAEQNDESLHRAKRTLHQVMAKSLTPLQKEIVMRYYFKKESIPQIARARGVNKSSVSRTLKSARIRMKNIMQYLDLRG